MDIMNTPISYVTFCLDECPRECIIEQELKLSDAFYKIYVAWSHSYLETKRKNVTKRFPYKLGIVTKICKH